MATYAIGDVHGCYATLKALLKLIAFNPNKDTLWFTGDLVNRGPKSLAVLQFVSELPNHVCVLGNHDLFLLAIWAGFSPSKAENLSSLDDILQAPERDHLLNWLRQQPLIHHENNITLVHAGIPPQWTLEQAEALGHEISHQLQSEQYIDFLIQMEGNQPVSWHQDLEGQDRWRYIINALTRMRFCTEQGALNLQDKSTPDMGPEGFSPWYAHHHHGVLSQGTSSILFGHWAATGGQSNHPQAIALDTGCVWGNKLTAFCLDDGKIWQENYCD